MDKAKWLLILLWLCSLAEAATGPEVAQMLNKRYRNTALECAGGNPAYFCSGVLLRGTQGALEFWKHSEEAVLLGAESFNYLRADLGTGTVGQPSGMIFSDVFTAIGQGKPLDVLCAYPFEFAVQSTRPDSGCGWVAAARSLQDVSSCSALGVTDAQGWLAHFAKEAQQPAGQCSLSSQIPAQFLASLNAHQMIDAQWSVQPMMVQVRNWDASAPQRLPILALFYDVNQAQALLNAQKDQRDYHTATGEWLPVLRLDLSAAPDAVFGFNRDDQLYVGYEVAARLNARSIEKVSECRDATASFNCTGVLIRSTDIGAFHSWNPSPQSVKGNGVSFTYITHGALIRQTYKPQGFVTRESFAPTGKPLTVRCLYPFDAATGGAPDICRRWGGQCEELGIETREAWVAKYASQPLRSCAFNTQPAAFDLATIVRPDATDPYGWNELIMAAWTEEEPQKLPLEAFTINQPSHLGSVGEGEVGARYIQRDYFEVTGRFLPVLRVKFSADPGSIFSYDPKDQALSDVATLTLRNAIPFLPNSLRDD